MPLVLAIEPDLRQAAIVKRIVREKVQAEVAVVDSRDAALEAMRTTIPDVLLLSALMSPRDEDELIAHLRTLGGADHLQTHTIPQLASSLGPGEEPAPRGLLSAFRRRKTPEAAPAGCDPDIFAEEIRSYLQRAAEKKRERVDAPASDPRADVTWRAAKPQIEAAPEAAVAEPTSGSSWASPFEWKPSNPSPNPSSLIPDPESLIADRESQIADPEPLVAASEPVGPEPVVVEAAAPVAESLMAHLRPPAGIPKMNEVLAPPLEEPTLAAAAIDRAPIQEPPIHDSPIVESRSGVRDKRLGAWARAETPARGAAKASDDLRELLSALAVPAAVVAVGYGRGCRIRRVRVPAAREPHEDKGADAVGAVILSRRVLAEERDRREPLRP